MPLSSIAPIATQVRVPLSRSTASVSVTSPPGRPSRGTCALAAAEPASPRTDTTARARLAVELKRVMWSLRAVCDPMQRLHLSAQTGRRGGAGPVGGLLGGKDPTGRFCYSDYHTSARACGSLFPAIELKYVIPRH